MARKKQQEKDDEEWETVSDPSSERDQDYVEPMVTRVETDETVPVSTVEKNIRRQIIRRESNNNEVLKRSHAKMSYVNDPIKE